MFSDAHLPHTDAWVAMTRDLRQSKESRNALSKENSYVSAINSEMRHDAFQATQATFGRIRIREGRVRCSACFHFVTALRHPF